MFRRNPIVSDERLDFEKVFGLLYQKVVQIASKMDVEPTIPRRTLRQKHRSNVSTDDPEEYYRISIGIEFLDHLISSLKDRFSEDAEKAFQTAQLLPFHVVGTDADFEELLSLYDSDLPNADRFAAELCRWKKHWSLKPEKSRPKSVMGMTDRNLSFYNDFILYSVFTLF